MKLLNTLFLSVSVAILDTLYKGRNFQRFWVLEEIARAPYFAFIRVLHLRESLGLRGQVHIDLMKEHFAQTLNETEHLEEMERREGNKYWIDRFFARHLVLFYYWVNVIYYMVDPINAYDLSEKIEWHAADTYSKYLEEFPQDEKISAIMQDEIHHAQELSQAIRLIT